MHASTDDIKAELISKRIKETGETQGQAFKSIEKEASTEFYNQVFYTIIITCFAKIKQTFLD